MAYNTGNPPGSTSAKDLIDNAEDLDQLMTGGAVSVPNRLGVPLKSWKGMEGEHRAAQARREGEFDEAQQRRDEEFSDRMESSGYFFVADYGPDVLIERFNEYVMKDGQPYRLSSLASVPYTTTGDWLTERDAFVLLGDDVLRQELANPAYGARILAFMPRGIHAVSRTVEEKNRDIVSLLDFGIRGDGSDETAKFINAIKSGETNFLLPKFATVKLTESIGLGSGGIAIPDGIKFHGGGKLLKEHGGSIFQIYNASNIDFEGIRFDGNLAWDEAEFGEYPDRTAYSTAIYAEGVSDLTVRRSVFSGFAQDILSVRSTWTEGHVPGDGAIGPSTLNSKNINFFHNTFTNWRNNAVHSAGIEGINIGRNTFRSQAGFTPGNNGIFLVELNKGGIISENRLTRIGDNAIGIGQTMNIFNLNEDILVLGNVIKEVVYPGILIGGLKKGTVALNTVRRANIEGLLKPGVAPIAGASILVIGGDNAQNSDILVTENQVSESGKRGIYAYDPSATMVGRRSRNIKILKNNVDGTDSLGSGQNEGIYVDLEDHTFVEHNTVYNAAGRGIAMSGAHTVSRNRVVAAGDIGIECFDSFWGLSGRPYTVTFNKVEGCGKNGIVVYNHRGSVVTDNEVKNCGLSSPGGYSLDDMLSRCGILVSYCDNSLVERNNVSGSGSCGVVVRFCNNYDVAKNSGDANGVLAGFTPAYRSGLYVLTFNSAAYKAGDIQSNRFTAGTTQQYAMAADSDLDTFGTAIGNTWDVHPNPIANISNKSWQQIFANA